MLQWHSLIRISRQIQCITLRLRPLLLLLRHHLTRRGVTSPACTTQFSRNFCFSTADSAALSKSMSSSSIKRWRVLMTLRCIASCWCSESILDALGKSSVVFIYWKVMEHWKQHFRHRFGIFAYSETAGLLSCRVLWYLPLVFDVTDATNLFHRPLILLPLRSGAVTIHIFFPVNLLSPLQAPLPHRCHHWFFPRVKNFCWTIPHGRVSLVELAPPKTACFKWAKLIEVIVNIPFWSIIRHPLSFSFVRQEVTKHEFPAITAGM